MPETKKTEDQAQTLSVCGIVDERSLSEVIDGMLSPILKTMAEMLSRNTEAMDRLASIQQAQSDRLEALEKQVRLNTPVTPSQVRYLSAEMRQRAKNALAKYYFESDKKAVSKLASAIKKAILTRCGAATLSEIPRHEYSIVIGQITAWNDMLAIRETVKEARARAEEAGQFKTGG